MPSKTTPKLAKDSFGVDADPVEFDLEEWLSGATLPARTVTIYRNAGLRAEYDALEHRFTVLQAKVGDLGDDAKDDDRTLDETGPAGELLDVAQRMKQVIADLEAGALTVKVQAITNDQEQKIQARIKKRNLSNDEAIAERMSAALVHPPMSPVQWARFREAIGETQAQKLVSVAVDLAGFRGEDVRVMPDFSPDVSALLATRES